MKGGEGHGFLVYDNVLAVWQLNMASWFTRVYSWPFEVNYKNDQPIHERITASSKRVARNFTSQGPFVLKYTLKNFKNFEKLS